MAGTSEILKAYVTLATDTTQMRAGLNKASADVEAWQRKQHVKVPLVPGGAVPGSAPGGIPSGGDPGVPLYLQSVTRRQQEAAAAADKHTESIYRQRQAYGRLMGVVSLGIGTFAAFFNIGKRLTEMFTKDGKEAAETFAASLNMVGDAAKGSFSTLQKQIDDLQRRKSAFEERGMFGWLFDIDASRGVVQSQLEELKALEKNMAEQLAAQRIRAREEAAQAEEAARASAAAKTLEAMRRENAELAASLLPTEFEQLSARYGLLFDDINRQAATATDARVRSELAAQAELLRERRDMELRALDATNAERRRVAQKAMDEAAADQRKTLEAAATAQTQVVAGFFNDLQRTISNINLQNIEGRLESIGQQVQLLARR